MAVQESLSLMSSAYADIDQSARILMEALITQNIEKVECQAFCLFLKWYMYELWFSS